MEKESKEAVTFLKIAKEEEMDEEFDEA